MKRLTTVTIASLAFLLIPTSNVEAKGFLKRLPVLKRVGSYRESLELKQHVASQNQEIAGLNDAVEERDSTIAKRNSVISQRDSKIAKQNDQIASQQASMTKMQANLKSRADEIAKQKQAISE